MNSEELNLIKEQILAGGKKLLADGLVARTWGNISIRVDDSNMLITPSGIHYEDLGIDDIVLVNYYSGRYKGEVKPSSELELHCEIYKNRLDINSVIHTHQTHASIVAVAHKKVPAILDDQAQIIGPDIRVSKYASSGSRKIARFTLKALKGRNAALMANHGAVCVGRDLDEAFVVCQVLEKTCKAFIESESLGGAKPINKIKASQMHQNYTTKYSMCARRK